MSSEIEFWEVPQKKPLSSSSAITAWINVASVLFLSNCMSQHSIICHNVLQNNSYRRAELLNITVQRRHLHSQHILLISAPYFVSTRQLPCRMPDAVKYWNTLHEREGAKMDNSIKIWSAIYSYVTREFAGGKAVDFPYCAKLKIILAFGKLGTSFKSNKCLCETENTVNLITPLTCVGDEE